MCSKGYCTVTKDASAACTSVVVNMAMTICYIYYWTEHAPIEATDGVSLVKQSRLKFHHAKHHYFTPFSGHGTSKRQNVDSKSAHKMEEQSRFLSRQTGHFCTYIWVEKWIMIGQEHLPFKNEVFHMPLHVPRLLPCLGVTFLFFSFHWDLVFNQTLLCKMCLSTPFSCKSSKTKAETDAACTSITLSSTDRIFGACI